MTSYYSREDSQFDPVDRGGPAGGGYGGTYGGGGTYPGGGWSNPTPVNPYSVRKSDLNRQGISDKWRGDYTFYDKLFENAMKDNEYEKGQGEYWGAQDKDAWEAEGNWMNNRPGQYGGYGVQRPGDWSFDGRRPTWEGPGEFNSEDWTGPEKYGAYQSQAFAGQPGWEEMKSEYERNRSSAPGGGYKGWTDVTLDSFDAEGAFNKYAAGAEGRFKSTLYDQLEDLQQTAAGRGRLNTGYFDEDTGTLSRKLSDDFRNDAMMKAIDVNGQQLDYIKAKGNVGLGNQEGRLKAYETGQSLAQGWQNSFNTMSSNWMSEKGKANALASDMLSGDRDFAKDTWKNKYDMSKDKYDAETGAYESDRDFSYKGHRDKVGDWESDRDFDKDTWETNYEAWSDTADKYRSRSAAASTNSKDWRDRYVDTATGLRGEWLGREEAAKDRKAAKDASKRQMWGNIIGGVIGGASKFIKPV